MNKRRATRINHRLACVLFYEGRRYPSLIRDVSANGLFVQTSASPEFGEPLELDVSLPGEEAPMRLQGQAARRRTVPARLRAIAQGGVGVRIVNAPEAYFAFIADRTLPKTKPEKDAAPSRRRPTSLERRARKLALRRALGPRMPAGEPTKPEKPAPSDAPPGSPRRYRLKVKCGPRSRSLDLSAESEEQARSLALRESGPGWQVLRCEPA